MHYKFYLKDYHNSYIIYFMKKKYYHRKIEILILEMRKQFPVLLLTGPRQSGKSTLLQHLFPKYHYVSLDDPNLQKIAIQDPELFLSHYEKPLIIDEIQYAPQLLAFIKIQVDTDRQNYGQFILTGSQQFQIMQGVTESLAGRVGIFSLFPFCWNEIYKDECTEKILANRIIRGFYPEISIQKTFSPAAWYGSYLSTYIERDVRNIFHVHELRQFHTFLQLLAARVGSFLNLSEIARDCGISLSTAKAWITCLEATYTIYLLQPYFRNITKRMVKSPKIYFVDTGLLCYLLQIDSAEKFLVAREKGSIFENFIIIDLLKQNEMLANRHNFYFYRTANGLEIDLIVEKYNSLAAYEIKWAKSLSSQMAYNLSMFGKDSNTKELHIISLQKEKYPTMRGVTNMYWNDLLTD